MPSFADALRALNQLKAEGVVEDYAIAGAMALVFWVEPVPTYDTFTRGVRSAARGFRIADPPGGEPDVEKHLGDVAGRISLIHASPAAGSREDGRSARSRITRSYQVNR